MSVLAGSETQHAAHYPVILYRSMQAHGKHAMRSRPDRDLSHHHHHLSRAGLYASQNYSIAMTLKKGPT